jgi:hypothetical protein
LEIVGATTAVDGLEVGGVLSGPPLARGDGLMQLVRNISCNSAGWGAVGHGSLTVSGNLHTAGWYCYVLKPYHSFGTLLGADVRCVQGGKAFRWTWGT